MVNFLLGHKAILIGLALLVAVGVWFGLSSGGSSSSDSLLTSEVVSENGPDRELVSTLLALRSVKLDGAIFQDPAFLTLKDFSTQIVPEPVGRPNPFAPLTQAAAVVPAMGQLDPNFAKPSGAKLPAPGNKPK